MKSQLSSCVLNTPLIEKNYLLSFPPMSLNIFPHSSFPPTPHPSAAPPISLLPTSPADNARLFLCQKLFPTNSTTWTLEISAGNIFPATLFHSSSPNVVNTHNSLAKIPLQHQSTLCSISCTFFEVLKLFARCLEKINSLFYQILEKIGREQFAKPQWVKSKPGNDSLSIALGRKTNFEAAPFAYGFLLNTLMEASHIKSILMQKNGEMR